MTVEEALRTALEYEEKVRDVYREAAGSTSDETGRRVWEVLSREEQGHLDYLHSRLEEWRATGRVRAVELPTRIPGRERIEAAMEGLQQRVRLPEDQRDSALAALRRAEEAERATAAFYRQVVGEIPGEEERRMFARFLEIEEGHARIVQAEIDTLTGMGFWFDVQEFRLEAE
ncbi:hypothetical protein KBD49_10805 [Myxococcota bacterium]|nr:hypothetical protein [Myxococcota bacterium]